MSNQQPQQNPSKDQDRGKPQAPPEPAPWKPDDNTFILIPDEPEFLRAAQDALRARFGSAPGGKPFGHIETTIDTKWLHKLSTVLVLPLRDKLPGEDPRPYKDPSTNQMIDTRKFAGFLECEPVSVSEMNERGNKFKYWREGRHAMDGTVLLRGDDGLVSALNASMHAGLRRMEDKTLEPAVAVGRVMMRLEYDKDRRTVIQSTLQLSAT